MPEFTTTFINDIRFNLISEKTISFIGKNDNIPKDILKDCYVKGRLISKGNTPYLLSFGRDLDIKEGQGKFHYKLKKYYIKLTSIKGQYDGAYKNSLDIKLSDFNCLTIYSNFQNIPKDKFILFEFKNGKGGEKKVIEQAKNYQKTAEFFLKEKELYHIIILHKKELANAISQFIKKNDYIICNLKNFAILCMNDKNEICQKKIENFSKRQKLIIKAQSQNKKKDNFKKIDKPNTKTDFEIESKISALQNDISTLMTLRTDVAEIKDKLENLFNMIASLKSSKNF